MDKRGVLESAGTHSGGPEYNKEGLLDCGHSHGGGMGFWSPTLSSLPRICPPPVPGTDYRQQQSPRAGVYSRESQTFQLPVEEGIDSRCFRTGQEMGEPGWPDQTGMGGKVRIKPPQGVVVSGLRTSGKDWVCC